LLPPGCGGFVCGGGGAGVPGGGGVCGGAGVPGGGGSGPPSSPVKRNQHTLFG